MSDHENRADVRGFLDMLRAHPCPELSIANVAKLRQQSPSEQALLDRPVGGFLVTRDVVMPGPNGDLRLRMFDSRSVRSAGPVAVFFHGGGFIMGSIDTHASICAEIAQRLDIPVVSVDYHLAPESPWPGAPDEAEAAARWIGANGSVFERDFTSIVLCGDSTGGNLAVVTGLALRDRPARLPVALHLLLYPSVDLAGSYPSNELYAEGFAFDRSQVDWCIERYAPDVTHWRASPILADMGGLAPTVLATAQLDPMRDQGRAFAAKLIDAGVPTTYLECPGMIHGFASYRRVIPSAQIELAKVLQAARSVLNPD